jgi:UDPglucose 6-dehydrogenase
MPKSIFFAGQCPGAAGNFKKRNICMDIKEKIIVGIVGCGFVGGALKKWLEEHNDAVKILVSDPGKGFNDAMDTADIVFISIHIPTEDDGAQDLTLLRHIIHDLPDKPVFIRTTLLPGTSGSLLRELNKKIYFMPEFLTERTAYEDFCRQPMVFTGEAELLKKIFTGKKYVKMTSLEAEIAKYAHNVFGALKVTFFNGIFDICKKANVDYHKVREGILLSGYINSPHTQVPGPDGQFGYGGKCFPKDVMAFAKKYEDYPVYGLLRELQSLNAQFRGGD